MFVTSDIVKTTTYSSEFKIKIRLGTIYPDNTEIGLIWFSCYNRIYNITDENNLFLYSVDNGDTFLAIKLPNGFYELKDLNSEIAKEVGEGKISFSIQPFNGRVIMKLSLNYQVDLKHGFYNLLGFEEKVYKDSTNIGVKLPEIYPVDTINIWCDSLQESGILYSFPLEDIPFGKKIIKEVNYPIFPKFEHRNDDAEVKFRILDQNGNLINFNGCKINLVIGVRSIKELKVIDKAIAYTPPRSYSPPRAAR